MCDRRAPKIFDFARFFSVRRRSLFTNIEKTIHAETQRQLKLSWPLLGARTLELGRIFSEGSKRG